MCGWLCGPSCWNTSSNSTTADPHANELNSVPYWWDEREQKNGPYRHSSFFSVSTNWSAHTITHTHTPLIHCRVRACQVGCVQVRTVCLVSASTNTYTNNHNTTQCRLSLVEDCGLRTAKLSYAADDWPSNTSRNETKRNSLCLSSRIVLEETSGPVRRMDDEDEWIYDGLSYPILSGPIFCGCWMHTHNAAMRSDGSTRYVNRIE